MSYLYYFNIEQDYFECHEYLEHLWFEEDRPRVLKGLIQAAVTLYHLNRGNVYGGYRMWQRARGYLMDGPSVCRGINVAKLIQDIDDVYRAVPEDWYTCRVAVEHIRSLHLPTVRIEIIDDEIRRQLATWTPEPIEDL